MLLFLHGHSSGAEEALDLMPHLLADVAEALGVSRQAAHKRLAPLVQPGRH